MWPPWVRTGQLPYLIFATNCHYFHYHCSFFCYHWYQYYHSFISKQGSRLGQHVHRGFFWTQRLKSETSLKGQSSVISINPWASILRGPGDFPRAISRAVFPNPSRLEAVFGYSLSISRGVLILYPCISPDTPWGTVCALDYVIQVKCRDAKILFE